MLLHKQLPLEHGLSVWYDNAESTRRLDTVGMMEAVAHSVCLLVIATRDYFSRKWCLFETQGEYALSFESLLAAQPSWCNHEILRTPDQNKLWDSWVRVTLATRLEEEMEAAKKKGVPVPERKKAGSDGGASLNQAHLDALKAVDLDLDTLAVTSLEELEEIFKELSVPEMKCAFAAATPQIWDHVLQGLLFNDWTCPNQFIFYTISILKILFRLASNFPFPFNQTQLSNTIRTNLPSKKQLRRDLTLNSNLNPN
eukprot:g14917.t1